MIYQDVDGSSFFVFFPDFKYISGLLVLPSSGVTQSKCLGVRKRNLRAQRAKKNFGSPLFLLAPLQFFQFNSTIQFSSIRFNSLPLSPCEVVSVCAPIWPPQYGLFSPGGPGPGPHVL